MAKSRGQTERKYLPSYLVQEKGLHSCVEAATSFHQDFHKPLMKNISYDDKLKYENETHEITSKASAGRWHILY